MPRYERVSLGNKDEKPDIMEIQRKMSAATEFSDQVILPWRHTPPRKFQAGMVVLADGVDWNPGSGAGMYVRDEANAAWLFIS